MECGSQDLFCIVLSWITDNETGATGLFEFAGRLGADSDGWVGVLSSVAKEYGQTIVGLLGVCFGFWRWWLYREKILHKRLSNYIAERDARLRGAREQLLETIQRPGPGQAHDVPVFVDRDLRSVLRERNWDSTVLALTIENSADLQLSGAIGEITRKLRIAERESACLRQELCTAYGIRGAIAAARSGGQKLVWQKSALDHFTSALQLPGHEGDVQLNELLAHQLRKLGELQAAGDAYQKTFNLAETIQDPRQRNISRARARRYMSEIESKESTYNAYLILTADLEGGLCSPGAIALMNSARPLSDWELTELGDMHYLTAYLASQQRFPKLPRNHLKLAVSAYERVLLQPSSKGWIKRRRARDRATEGAARATRAIENGIYDMNWLGLPLEHTKQTPGGVGTSSSN